MIHHLEGQAKKLSAYVGEDEHYESRQLYQALIEQARAQGCAGATALRGLAGYGASSRDVAKHGLRMSSDIPVVVSVIDEPVRITALAEVWAAMMPAGLLTMEDVCVALYCGDTDELDDAEEAEPA
jgi:PII-like signaling protein